MTKLIGYIRAAVIAALPAIFAVAQNANPSGELQLRASSNPDTMVWSYPGESQARNFKDNRPFGSLDEVVLRTKEGTVKTLHPGDDEFAEQERVYVTVVAPYFNGQ